MGIKFEFLKAKYGDSIFISTDNTNILIDGGFTSTYTDDIKPRIKRLEEENKKLDLLILTHYDDDHIVGLNKLLIDENEKFDKTVLREVWYNSFEKEEFETFRTTTNNELFETGAKKAKKFENLICNIKPYITYRHRISIDTLIEPIESNTFTLLSPRNSDYQSNQELKITLLSPNNEKLFSLEKQYRKDLDETGTRKSDWAKDANSLLKKVEKEKDRFLDSSLANGSSLAFILEYKSNKYLFLGDAHIDLIVSSLKEMNFTPKNPLEVEFIKLSHHGSRGNMSKDFLSIVKSKNFVVMSNGKRNKHPDKETLVRIIDYYKNSESKIKFLFNYEPSSVFEGIELFSQEELSNANISIDSFELVYQHTFKGRENGE